MNTKKISETKDNIKKSLHQSLFFSSFSQDQLHMIADIAFIKIYKPRQVIFLENDLAETLFIIKKGKVKIFKISPEGKEQILHIFTKGDSIGEVAMFSKGCYPANAESMDNTEIIGIPKKNLMEIFKKDPLAAMSIIAVLSQRLRYFTMLVENLTLKDLQERLALYIISQMKYQNNEQKIFLEYSKGELAKILGCTQEALSRNIKKLCDDEIIEVSKRVIHITDSQKLKEIASTES